MKKLTAGIFATLLAVVSADGAYAAIASSGYVDDKVGVVQTAVDAVEGNVSTLQTTVAGKADKATTLSGYGITDAYTSAEGSALEGRVSAVEAPKAQVAANVTGPVSGGTVYTAIQGVSGNVGTVTSDVATLKQNMTQAQEDISGLKEASANHVVKNEAITGGTHTKITYDAKGLVTAGANLTADDIPEIPNTKVSGLGSLATKSSVATTDIASQAVTKEKLATDIVTSLGKADSALQEADLADYVTKEAADAAYADIATEGVASTASGNAQTALTNIGTLSQLTTDAKGNTVAAINEVAKEAADAQSTATGAQSAVDAVEAKIGAYGDIVSHDASEFATTTALTSGLAGKLDTDGTAARATADATGNVITTTYATKEEIAGMATDANLALKQDKTDEGLATTNKTVVGAINEVKGTADNASTAAAAAQTDATQALEDAATAQRAAEAAQSAADLKLPTATYTSQVGTVSASNMGTTATTVVAAIKEVAGEAAAAQSTASSANTAAGAAQDAAEAAQETANAAIPKPSGECSDPANKCVLTWNNSAYAWEVIERGAAE